MQKKYKNSYKATERALVSLSVYNVGFQNCDPGYQWGPGVRDHYLIHYVYAGRGTYQTKGSTYDLCTGDAFLVYPHTEIIYRADDETPWEYAWVGFTGSDAAMILRATDFSERTPCIFQVKNGEEIRRQLLHIYDARGSGFEHAVEMAGRLYTTLALFLKSAHRKESKNTASTYVQKSIEYISANYSYAITVEDIAAYVGLSRSHLFRSFTDAVGQSPKEYLTNFRMKQACYLLEHSDLSVTAIANSVGFDNGLYFSRTFHRKKGMPPKEYRAAKKEKKGMSDP